MNRLLLSFILLVLLLLPTQGWGAIALDTFNSALSNTTTATITGYIAASGSVLVCSAGSDNQRMSGITFNSVNLTELYDNTADGAGSITGIAAYITTSGTDGGAHDIVATWNTSGGGPHSLFCASFTGVNVSSDAAAHRTIYTGGDSAGLAITVVDSQSGDWVVHGVFNFGTNMTAGQTSIITTNGLFSGSYDHMLQRTAASGANTAMTTTGGHFATGFAFALVPASAGADPNFYGRRLAQ